jgi:hypothetical protein
MVWAADRRFCEKMPALGGWRCTHGAKVRWFTEIVNGASNRAGIRLEDSCACPGWVTHSRHWTHPIGYHLFLASQRSTVRSSEPRSGDSVSRKIKQRIPGLPLSLQLWSLIDYAGQFQEWNPPHCSTEQKQHTTQHSRTSPEPQFSPCVSGDGHTFLTGLLTRTKQPSAESMPHRKSSYSRQ